jgi:hypothetical protein
MSGGAVAPRSAANFASLAVERTTSVLRFAIAVRCRAAIAGLRDSANEFSSNELSSVRPDVYAGERPAQLVGKPAHGLQSV